MHENIKIAVVQMAPQLMETGDNLRKIITLSREAATNGANLIVFPECSLTGYVFTSRQEALPYGETIPGPSVEELCSICQENEVHVIFGLLEKDSDRLFNAAVLLGPLGIIGKYRKNHLPFLGIDRFVDSGDKPFQVHQTQVGNIGLYICYDIVFPESSRVMTLMGADLLASPTNFPRGRRERILTDVVITRAIENTVHVVVANRVGEERGCLFAGQSIIVDAAGDIVSVASSDREEIMYGEVSLEMARQKHITVIPGEYEMDHIKDRRPELYGAITKPNPKE